MKYILGLMMALYALAANAVAVNQYKANSIVPSSASSAHMTGIEIGSNAYSMVRQPDESEQRRISAGLSEYICTLPGGRYKTYRDSETSHHKVSQTMTALAVPRAAAEGLNESFEGYTGAGWLPSGWESKSLVTGTSVPSEAWHVTGAIGSFSPTNGKYQAFLEFSESKQDEWLISPEFTVKSGTRLYADVTLSLFSIYDAANYDVQSGEFSKRKVTATVAVRVLSDGNWEEIWNARDVASRISDKELYEHHAGPEKETLRIPLDAYAGKNIRVAFVYYGAGGNSVAVDYISVATPNNLAVYHRPRGFFFEGMNEEYMGDADYAALVGPAYTEARWNSLYTRDVQTVEWKFNNPENIFETISTTDWTPAYSYPYSITYAPTLTAKSNGLPSLAYTYDIANEAEGIVKYGGGGTDMKDSSIVYGCGAYNWRCGFQGPMYASEAGAFLFGPTSNSAFWESAGIHLVSIASIYEKPLSTYWFDKFWIHANELDADPDAEFVLNLYRIDDNGIVERNPFSTSTLKAENVLKFNSGNGYLYSLVFNFGVTEIDHAMLVELTGYMDNAKVRKFSPLTQNNPHVDAESNGYVFYTKNGKLSLSPTASLLYNFYCPFIFTMNAAYSFMLADTGQWQAPDEGGEYKFNIKSCYLPSEWDIEGDIPEWVNTFETFEEEDADGDIRTGLKVGVDPLENVDRQWNFTLKIPGARQAFTITQGESAGMCPIYADQESAAVYDLGGRKVGNGADGLQPGIYIVREKNGVIHKIIR